MANSERAQNSFARFEVACPVISVEEGDAETFERENQLDDTTLACLRAVYPEDYPVQPTVSEGQLAHYQAQIPEYHHGSDLPAGSQPDGHRDPSTLQFRTDTLLDVGEIGNLFDPPLPDFDLSMIMPMLDYSSISELFNPNDLALSADSESLISTGVRVNKLPLQPEVGLGRQESTSEWHEVAVAEPRKKPGTSKIYCAMKGCNLVAKSGRCLRRMCKAHCEMQRDGSCPAHRTTSELAPIGSAMSRPPLATNNTVTNLPTAKEYRTDMSPAHRQVWERNKEQQEAEAQSKRQRMEYQRSFVQQVVIYAWMSVSTCVVQF